MKIIKNKIDEAISDIVLYQDVNTKKVYTWDPKTKSYVEYDTSNLPTGKGKSGPSELDPPLGDNKNKQKGKQDGASKKGEQKPDNKDSEPGDSKGDDNETKKGSEEDPIDNTPEQGEDGDEVDGTPEKGDKSKTSRTPQIGDYNRSDIMDQEDAEREKEYEENPELAKYAKDPERLNRLKAKLEDPSLFDKISKENKAVKNKEKYDAEKRKADWERQREERAKFKPDESIGDLEDFDEDLQDFIDTEIMPSEDPWDVEYDSTYSRYNKRYGYLSANGGVIMPGYEEIDPEKPMPVVAVYYDRSQSWDDAKSASGKKVVDKLKKYEQDGLLVLDQNYFSETVHKVSSYSEKGSKNADIDAQKGAKSEGGTDGQPILDDILKTEPDNVIIITDSDIGDCKSYVSVPGSVWLVFKEGVSENLCKHIRGKTFTRYYDITNS